MSVGWGEDGWGLGAWGGTMGTPLYGNTILADSLGGRFIVEVVRRLTVTKPTQGATMMGSLVPDIRHFWPLWEGAGDNVEDISAGYNGVKDASSTWSSTGKIGPSMQSTGAGVVIPTITVASRWSLERLQFDGTNWHHKVQTQLKDGTGFTYDNGALVSTLGVSPRVLSMNNLFDPGFNGKEEFVRVWRRDLTEDEVAALFLDPYLMFGCTQAMLDEISTVVNFMRPARSQWRFVDAPGS